MTTPPNRQTRKRLATRQRISDVATELFLRHGFDQVKIEEIAEAADVSRMTVFNHFARKEDLFFDLDVVVREEMLDALAQRDPAMSPVEALRRFAHLAIAKKRPYARFFTAGSARFMATLYASETLVARARAIRDELTNTLTEALAQPPGAALPYPAASLAAAFLVATWTVALDEAYKGFQSDGNAVKANKVLLALVDRGTKAAQAVLDDWAC